MNESYSPPIMVRILAIPVIGDLICNVLYGLMKVIVPVFTWLSDGDRLKIGVSRIWFPKEKKEAVLKGVEFLKKHDEQLYLRLTSTSRPLLFYYSSDAVTANNGGPIYGLNERFMCWGPGGVATFLVQSLLMFEASPSLNQVRITESKLERIRNVPNEVLQWMCSHSIRADLIDAYRGGVVAEHSKNYAWGRVLIPERKTAH
ncbi:MAG TPA: hypothetical protein VFM25_10505 [Verrucomicrobiae bacterium]|nr:hypothetical protein [Verrucomicrobiae bacterium]